MTIQIIRAGQLKDVKKIFVLKQGVWKEVLLVQAVGSPEPGTTTQVLQTVYNKYQAPPTGLYGTVDPGVHTACTIAWTSLSDATEYHVTYRPRAPGATTFGPLVDSLPWTPNASMVVNGLAPNMEYTFTVEARRFAIDGTEIRSKPSLPITLDTGYDALTIKNPSYSADPVGYPAGKPDLVLISAAKTDTWTSSYNWGTYSYGPDVIQGYKYSSWRARNAYGVVVYTTARTQLGTEVKRIDPNPLSPVDINKITVTDAKIDSIYRKSGGSGTPVIRIYPWKYDVSPVTQRPAAYGGTTTGTTFRAPLEGKFLDELVLPSSKLLTWSREWIKATPVHNGMLIYNAAAATGSSTAGFNGYTIFRSCKASNSASGVADWRLKLWVKWNYIIPAKAAAWIPTRP